MNINTEALQAISVKDLGRRRWQKRFGFRFKGNIRKKQLWLPEVCEPIHHRKVIKLCDKSFKYWPQTQTHANSCSFYQHGKICRVFIAFYATEIAWFVVMKASCAFKASKFVRDFLYRNEKKIYRINEFKRFKHKSIITSSSWIETKLQDEKNKKFNRRHQTLLSVKKKNRWREKLKKCLAVTENVRTRIVLHRSRHHQTYFVLLNLRHFLNSFNSFSSFD